MFFEFEPLFKHLSYKGGLARVQKCSRGRLPSIAFLSSAEVIDCFEKILSGKVMPVSFNRQPGPRSSVENLRPVSPNFECEFDFMYCKYCFEKPFRKKKVPNTWVIRYDSFIDFPRDISGVSGYKYGCHVDYPAVLMGDRNIELSVTSADVVHS